MKLIIEQIDGTVYAYRVSNKQFKKIKDQLKPSRDPQELDTECDLSGYGNFSMVFDCKRK